MAGDGSTPSGFGQRDSAGAPPPANRPVETSPANPNPMAVVAGSTKPAPWYGVSTHPWTAAPSDVGPQYKTLWSCTSPAGHVWVASWPWAQYGSPLARKAASQLACRWGPAASSALVVTGGRFSPKDRR